jgi:hypothetical protein
VPLNRLWFIHPRICQPKETFGYEICNKLNYCWIMNKLILISNPMLRDDMIWLQFSCLQLQPLWTWWNNFPRKYNVANSRTVLKSFSIVIYWKEIKLVLNKWTEQLDGKGSVSDLVFFFYVGCHLSTHNELQVKVKVIRCVCNHRGSRIYTSIVGKFFKCT